MADADLRNRLMQAVNDAFDDQIAFTQQMVRFPSLMGEEAECQGFMADAMAERGFEVDHYRVDPHRLDGHPGASGPVHDYGDAWNAVGTLNREGTGRSLILNGHIDVVPTGRRDGWTADPFDPVIRDGWLYGRGSGDMKAGLVAGLFAHDAIRAVGMQPAGRVHLQSVIDEECGGLAALSCLERGYRADGVVVMEPSMTSGKAIITSMLGVNWMTIRVKGAPSHASGSFGAGASAIDNAVFLHGVLKDLEDDWNRDKADHSDYAGADRPIRINVGTIEGGEWRSSQPSECLMGVRFAIFPGERLDAAHERIAGWIEARCAEHPYLSHTPPELAFDTFRSEAYVTPEGTDLEAELLCAHRACHGEDLKRVATSGTADSRFYGLYDDTPALLFGPDCRGAHGFDECVNLASVRQVTQTLALFIAGWCGLEEQSDSS
ncbi:MAG: ArgE/DapE family deacylase [Pseudomonadota bacterium]